MTRLTVNLPDDLHRALKEAAARRGSTMGELVAESLELYGIKVREDAERLVAEARRAAAMSDEDATDLAAAETRAARDSRPAESEQHG